MRSHRRLAVVLLILLGLLLSFYAGHWTGRMTASLGAEAEYPWELHQKIGRADLSCDKLASAPRTGRFLVLPLDGGSVLLVVSYDPSKQFVVAYVIDSGGRYATDSWTLECK
jgi:hypothetical protein